MCDEDNNNIIITTTMFMVLSSWHSHCESWPGSLMNADWAPGGHQPSDQTNRFGLRVRRKIGCYHPQTPSPFITITQLISWYSFYRPTEGRRLSWPRQPVLLVMIINETNQNVHSSGIVEGKCHSSKYFSGNAVLPNDIRTRGDCDTVVSDCLDTV